ncbi:hypothetical protein QJQ45_005747 [Haematococcus lacustris]|nr:hypothetical protein QJQ45_005747 [Haematococcus lacustris]
MASMMPCCSQPQSGRMPRSTPVVAPRLGVMQRRGQPTMPPRSRQVQALAVVRDEASGVEFPVVQKFWQTEDMRCLGCMTRSKKFMIVAVKVYSVAAYVEAERCAKELGVRSRGGFFENDDDYCSALLDGAFSKALLIRLVRDVEGQQFLDALNTTLVPRMSLAGETAKLAEFQQVFEGKKLVSGTEIAMVGSVVGDLDVTITGPGASRAYDSVTPERRIQSMALTRGLFELFLGSNSVVPQARPVWSQGAKLLLESEEVKRATRKSGS